MAQVGKKHSVVLITAVLLVSAFSTSAAEAPWRDLFNGRDLTGW